MAGDPDAASVDRSGPSITVRRVRPTDEDALAALAEGVADGGRVAFTTKLAIPLLEAVGPDAVGFLAETPTGAVAGAGWVRPATCEFLGETRTYAMLYALSVAPEFRRQGVAARLTQARLDWIRERGRALGEDIIPMATIQSGNAASLANARRWAATIVGGLRVTPVPVRHRRPRGRAEWRVRAAAESDLPAVAEALAAGPAVALGPDHRVEVLATWLSRTVRDTASNSYYVVTDAGGRVLAGLGVHDDSLASRLQVTRMPRTIALANRVVRVVDADGAMRTGQVVLAWHREGEQAAGRYLWQDVLWQWRGRVTSLVTTVDARDPFAAMTRAPRWMPATGISLALALPEGTTVSGPVRPPL